MIQKRPQQEAPLESQALAGKETAEAGSEKLVLAAAEMEPIPEYVARGRRAASEG